MRYNWIQHTTTGGSGALTLTEMPNFPSWKDALGTSANLEYPVEYDIIDPTNGNYEFGQGTFNPSLMRLSRVEVRVTFSGGVYNTNSPGAINFSSSALVKSAAMAESAVPTLQYVETALGSHSGFFAPASTIGAGFWANEAITANLAYYQPFHWTRSIVINTAGMLFQTGPGGSGHVRIGLYYMNTAGRPGKLLCDFGTLSGPGTNVTISNTNSSWITFNTPFILPMGWYYSCAIFDTTGASNAQPVNFAQDVAGNALPYPGGPFSVDFSPNGYLTATQSYGALPDPASLSSVAMVHSTTIDHVAGTLLLGGS